MEQTKKCSHCKRILPVTEFYKNASKPDGFSSFCKECQNETQKKSQKKRDFHKGGNPDLALFTPRQLIEELKARGYTGELQYIQKIRM